MSLPAVVFGAYVVYGRGGHPAVQVLRFQFEENGGRLRLVSDLVTGRRWSSFPLWWSFGWVLCMGEEREEEWVIGLAE